MGTILDSVNNLSDKLGITAREQTIKDQLDLCVERLGGEGNSVDIAESANKFADKEDGTATFTTKSITENGTYDATDDGVSGYSSVTVDVSSGGGVGFNHIKTVALCYGSTLDCEIINSDDGVYEYTSSKNNSETDNITAFSPLKTFDYIMTHDYSRFSIAFTPHSDFDPNTAFTIFTAGSHTISPTIDSSGDTVTPGDGLRYTASLVVQDSGSSVDISVQFLKKANAGDWVNVIE